INSTYYTFLSKKSVLSWLKNTDPDFKFTVKIHRELTQNASRDYPLGKIDGDIAGGFLDSVSPLIEEGRLITLLAQFGPGFTKRREHGKYLIRLRELMGKIPMVIEFRHPSWLLAGKRDDTFQFLARHNLGYVSSDLPDNPRLPPLVPHVIGNIGYLRLHGHNKNWFGQSTAKRYDYNYSDDELKSLIPIIGQMDERARLTIVAFNNCHGGQALQNALRLKELLKEASDSFSIGNPARPENTYS
ncbi:MAG: DUF72 domain-containing protein, partial [Candidatus Eremiobacteraeota bacterium]|nr:DUF72 domain-containing protein [Candidatus Eremiobacteraeota bacterium]